MFSYSFIKAFSAWDSTNGLKFLSLDYNFKSNSCKILCLARAAIYKFSFINSSAIRLSSIAASISNTFSSFLGNSSFSPITLYAVLRVVKPPSRPWSAWALITSIDSPVWLIYPNVSRNRSVSIIGLLIRFLFIDS